MKLAKSDILFVDACVNPEKRSALIQRLLKRRKWLIVTAGFLAVMAIAENIARLCGQNITASYALLFHFLFIAGLAMHVDFQIKTLLALK
jgi:hypothetical protein